MHLHLFNPGYEAGIAIGYAGYTPSANVQRMRRELALLPLCYGEPEDYVLVEGNIDQAFLSSVAEHISTLPSVLSLQKISSLDSLPSGIKATPWGLSPQSVRFFETIQHRSGRSIVIPQWKNEYTELIGRRTSAVCLDRIRSLMPDYSFPSTPLFCRTVEEIDDYISKHHTPFIIKTPYSSSGRGLLWINLNTLSEKEKQWIRGALGKQQEVSIEHALPKTKDFAMEFLLNDQGKAMYKGLSLFETLDTGAYAGNILQPQHVIENTLTERVGTDLFYEVKDKVGTILEDIYGKLYTGHIGVDMLIYADNDGHEKIHPFVEVNMRNTMGMVSITLFERIIHPSSTGHFKIAYEKDAYQQHTALMENHPPQWENGKLRKGYLSLCPVSADTRYRCYVLVN